MPLFFWAGFAKQLVLLQYYQQLLASQLQVVWKIFLLFCFPPHFCFTTDCGRSNDAAVLWFINLKIWFTGWMLLQSKLQIQTDAFVHQEWLLARIFDEFQFVILNKFPIIVVLQKFHYEYRQQADYGALEFINSVGKFTRCG